MVSSVDNINLGELGADPIKKVQKDSMLGGFLLVRAAMSAQRRAKDSHGNEALLADQGMQSGLCPHNPAELKERLADPAQREGMKRRGGTAARVAIFKNVILGNPVRSKSIRAHEQATDWTVLSHNLWVLARMEKATKEESEVKRKAKAKLDRAMQEHRQVA